MKQYKNFINETIDNKLQMILHSKIITYIRLNKFNDFSFVVDEYVEHNFQEELSSRSPLHYAVKEQRAVMVDYLIKNGFNINEKVFKNTPLSIAVKDGFIEGVKILIDGGADLNIVNDDGDTALLSASYKLFNRSEYYVDEFLQIIDLLLDKTDISIINTDDGKNYMDKMTEFFETSISNLDIDISKYSKIYDHYLKHKKRIDFNL